MAGTASIVAASLAAVLLNLVLAAPERVERLVLLSPAVSFARPVPQFYLRRALRNRLPRRPLIYSLLPWASFAPLDTRRADVE